jgi:hypothetical protein
LPLEMCAIYLSTLMLAIIIIDHSLDTHSPDPIPWRPPCLPHHRPTKDVLPFSAKEQATWDRLLPRRHPLRLSQVASHRRVRGDVRVSQSFRVRMPFSGRVSVLPHLTCSVAPIRVATIPLCSMSLPLTISSKNLALAIPLPHLPVFGLVDSPATDVWRPP